MEDLPRIVIRHSPSPALDGAQAGSAHSTHSGGFSPSRVSFTSHCVEFHLPFWRAELTVGVPFWSAYVWSTTRHVWSVNVEVSLLETYCWSTFVEVLLLESQ